MNTSLIFFSPLGIAAVYNVSNSFRKTFKLLLKTSCKEGTDSSFWPDKGSSLLPFASICGFNGNCVVIELCAACVQNCSGRRIVGNSNCKSERNCVTVMRGLGGVAYVIFEFCAIENTKVFKSAGYANKRSHRFAMETRKLQVLSRPTGGQCLIVFWNSDAFSQRTNCFESIIVCTFDFL